jgi:hypothetical protein
MSNKTTKTYCLRNNNLYVGWDGKTMTDRPSKAGRFSRTMAERKYSGYEMIPFPEAYDQWYASIKAANSPEGCL